MLAEPLAEAVDQRGQRVDGQSRLVEPGRLAGVGGEVQDGELPEPDGVVGHDVGHGRARDLGPDPPELGGDLLVGELLVVVVVVEVVELGVAGCSAPAPGRPLAGHVLS